ncbi:glycosyltransferase family 4 protein [Bradyrhizobium sp. RDM12]
MNETTGHHAKWLSTESAYLRPRRLPLFFRAVLQFYQTRREPYDVVWLQYVNIADLLFLPVARMMGKKIIVTPHLGPNWTSTRNRFLRSLSSQLLKLCDRVAYLSETQLTELTILKSIPKSRIRTLLPRALLQPRQPALKSGGHTDRIRLIHASRLSHAKGTFRFVDVCKILAENGVSFDAEIIGPCDPETKNTLIQRIDDEKLSPLISVVDALPEDKLADRLGTADFLVHLSQLDSFPLIVLESLAAGAFPICIDLPGASAMTREYCGAVVSAERATESTAALILKSDVADIRQATKETRKKVQSDYSWNTCVACLEDCVNSLKYENRRTPETV